MGRMDFEIADIRDGIYLLDDFEDVIHVSLGSGRFYYVLKDGVPYLRLEVDFTQNSFDTAILFCDYLCIGVFDRVYFVDLKTSHTESIQVDFYFGYFYVWRDDCGKEWLLILSGTGATAFDENLNKYWENIGLAVDGIVVVDETEHRYLLLDCEMDPPGGWVKKRIDLLTGAEIRQEDLEYIKVLWAHDEEDAPEIIYYEVNTEDERLLLRSIDIYKSGEVKCIGNSYAGAIEITSTPTVEEINAGIWGEELRACAVGREEFENVWNSKGKI